MADWQVITSADPFYFDTTGSSIASGEGTKGSVHFKYKSNDRRFDKRAAYYNAKWPYIEAPDAWHNHQYLTSFGIPNLNLHAQAVHKFRVVHKWVKEWDVARFNIPARAGSGRYLIHMLWRGEAHLGCASISPVIHVSTGYRDGLDVDVLPGPANDIHGAKATTVEWT